MPWSSFWCHHTDSFLPSSLSLFHPPPTVLVPRRLEDGHKNILPSFLPSFSLLLTQYYFLAHFLTADNNSSPCPPVSPFFPHFLRAFDGPNKNFSVFFLHGYIMKVAESRWSFGDRFCFINIAMYKVVQYTCTHKKSYRSSRADRL